MAEQCSLKNNAAQSECGCAGHNSKILMTLVAVFGVIGATGHYFFGWF